MPILSVHRTLPILGCSYLIIHLIRINVMRNSRPELNHTIRYTYTYTSIYLLACRVALDDLDFDGADADTFLSEVQRISCCPLTTFAEKLIKTHVPMALLNPRYDTNDTHINTTEREATQLIHSSLVAALQEIDQHLHTQYGVYIEG